MGRAKLWYLSPMRAAKASLWTPQSCQNLRCSHIEAVDLEVPLNKKRYPWPLWKAGYAHLKLDRTECSKAVTFYNLWLCWKWLFYWLRCAYFWKRYMLSISCKQNITAILYGIVIPERRKVHFESKAYEHGGLFPAASPPPRVHTPLIRIKCVRTGGAGNSPPPPNNL